MTEYNKEEWRHLIEQYTAELMTSYGDRAQPTVVSLPANETPANNTVEEQQSTEETNGDLVDVGQLQVRVSTENQAIPIVGATVTVTHKENGQTYLTRLLITDENGLTEIIDLPTKDRGLSLVPGNIAPYAVYTVDVSAEGYFPKRFLDLPIYGGVTAIQSVSMIPLPEAGGDDIVLTYPQNGPENL